jgi:hypothetical protein
MPAMLVASTNIPDDQRDSMSRMIIVNATMKKIKTLKNQASHGRSVRAGIQSVLEPPVAFGLIPQSPEVEM